MSSTLERLESTEKSTAQVQAQAALLAQGVSKLEASVAQQESNTMQYLQFVMQKVMAMEQSLTSLAKMSYALTDELVASATVSNKSIMTRIRRQDEEGERKRVADLVTANTLKVEESVGEASTLAYSQDFFRAEVKTTSEAGEETVTPSSTETIAEFRILELASQNLSADIKAKFLGKKAGETVELPNGNNKSLFTILAVYGLVTGEKQGEEPQVQAAQAALAAETAPATETQPAVAQQ